MFDMHQSRRYSLKSNNNNVLLSGETSVFSVLFEQEEDMRLISSVACMIALAAIPHRYADAYVAV
jgi:hypothetical protein